MSTSVSKMELVRVLAYNDCIIGKLLINGVYVCDTLEPNNKDKYGCIPEGSYPVHFMSSVKFNRILPVVTFVPGRSGIEFHPGNNPQDTKGCILPGYHVSMTKHQVLYSKVALEVIMKNILSTDFVELDIYEAFSKE